MSSDHPDHPDPVLVPEEVWTAWQQRHTDTVDLLTSAHLRRRRHGQAHPVVDFLFTYYRTSVATIRRWHPGPGLILENAHRTPRRDWRHYVRDSRGGRTGLRVDPGSVMDRRGARIRRARDIIAATASRPGALGCFGLHEWAMLYRTGETDARHGGVPLRLSPGQIDDVVRRSGVRCTHFDAFRFFTEPARPLNQVRLTRDGQTHVEQPACLHAGMDLYAHIATMEAGAPGELLIDTLTAAFDARELDMRSSPYDLTEWGLDPIRVETAEGRAEFVAHQREWITRTQILRGRVLAAIDRMEPHTEDTPLVSA